MKIEKTALSGVFVLTPARHGDSRGFFSECWNQKTLAAHGITVNFVQDNHSFSNKIGVIRGLHFQAPPHAQTKLVRCGRGALFDVVVDIRRGSPTYGHWSGHKLSYEGGQQLLIPAGFLHGFITLTDETEIIYKCSDYYASETEGAVRYDDADLAIDWNLGKTKPVLSEKDAVAPLFRDFVSPFEYSGNTT